MKEKYKVSFIDGDGRYKRAELFAVSEADAEKKAKEIFGKNIWFDRVEEIRPDKPAVEPAPEKVLELPKEFFDERGICLASLSEIMDFVEMAKAYRGFPTLIGPLLGKCHRSKINAVADVFSDYQNGRIDDDEIANDGFVGICVDYYCGDADAQEVIDYFR